MIYHHSVNEVAAAFEQEIVFKIVVAEHNHKHQAFIKDLKEAVKRTTRILRLVQKN